MSADPQAPASAGVGQPRRAVIEQAWRAIGSGVEVLSADDGGPLTRTLKRIIDPLVLRLRSNPQYSAPVVAADAAAAMSSLIAQNAPIALHRSLVRLTEGRAPPVADPQRQRSGAVLPGVFRARGDQGCADAS
ncbi:hypothetical protein IWGMT90018_60050 [Mycobacterium kiyosense]|nr:hypothetical protein IWGMT90018_60050 [Mycobacterium kiyosense]